MNDGSATHEGEHEHLHGPGCGHTAIEHEGHVDYLHDGHLHHQSGSAVQEHVISVSADNPDGCDPVDGSAHEPGHHHDANCGHEAVPHGDHIDYLVGGRLHHPHGDHCDDHGAVAVQ